MNKNVLFQIILLITVFIFFTASPIFGAGKRLVIFPLNYTGDPSKAYLVQAVKNMLDTRLGGGIELIEDEKLNTLFNEKEKQGIISLNKIRETAGKLDANYAIFGSVTTAGMSSSLDFSILDLTNKTAGPFKISEIVGEDQIIKKTADIAKQFRAMIQGGEITAGKNQAVEMKAPPSAVTTTTKKHLSPFQDGRKTEAKHEAPEAKAPDSAVTASIGRPFSSLKLTGVFPIKQAQVMSFDLTDLNRDGSPEWIVLERTTIKIFSKEKGTMVQKDNLNPSLGETFFKVNVGDADGNGIPEIYVVSLYGQVTRTSVWEWQGKFKLLFRLSGSVRVLKDIKNKLNLIFQDCKAEGPLSGMIYFMQYDQERKLNLQEPLKQLKNIQFFTLAFMDLDKDGNTEILGLDNNSYLCIWDREGNGLWKSKDPIGGTNNAIIMDNAENNPPDVNYSTPLNSRLVFMDIDRDGLNEIIAVQNSGSYLSSFSKRLINFISGHILVYKIEGRKLVPAWNSEEIKDCITEIQTDGQSLFLSTEKGQPASFFKGTSQMMWID